MIEQAWNDYRGWANRARTLKSSSSRWVKLAFICGVLAAVLGAAATQVPQGLARTLSFLAAVAAALSPILGQAILDEKREAGWIRSRATAEAIKSECFRYAARAGDYAADERDAAFEGRLETFANPGLSDGLTPLADPTPPEGDPRRPPLPMTRDWYLNNRLGEQERFYGKGQGKHEKAAADLRALVLATAIVTAVLGAAGSTFGVTSFAPWIAVLTTVGATVVAYGFMDRQQFLGATYGAMLVRLGHLRAHTEWDLGTLVARTEDLLQAEHAAWTDRITKTIVVPPSQKPDA